MIAREMQDKLLTQAQKFPVVSITGPRQSGKTTLAKTAFPQHEYLSFEDPDTRDRFIDDPRGFLDRYKQGAIFDEAQRVPELFSYLQGVVDESDTPGRFVVTGSQDFLLSKAIGQSLAGRVAPFTLLPLSCRELAKAGRAPKSALEWVLHGGYPRLFKQAIEPGDFFPGYVQTYLQRDVREELGVRSLSDFGRFLQLCALSCGEVLNITSLASDCGISVATARGWLSVLEASHIIWLLQPFFANARKRLIKSPKLYLLDTGLACSLLGIESEDELFESDRYGHLFEAAVVSEVVKRQLAQGRTPRLSFWRDSNGREIDLLIERGPRVLRAVEIKSSTTYRPSYFDMVSKIAPEIGLGADACSVVYGGEEGFHTSRGNVVPFGESGELTE